jgi:hypothetical protein
MLTSTVNRLLRAKAMGGGGVLYGTIALYIVTSKLQTASRRKMFLEYFTSPQRGGNCHVNFESWNGCTLAAVL